MRSISINTGKRLRLAGLVGAGVLTIAGAVVASISIGWQQDQIAGEVTLSSTHRMFPTLEALRKESVAVIVGQVAGKGTTELLPLSVPTQSVAPPVHVSPKQGVSLSDAAVAPRQSPADVNGLPITTYTVEVTQLLSGSLTPGSTIKLKQLGGTVSGSAGKSQTIEDHHDPLLVPGERQIFFLGQNADGSYFVTGGPQGRLRVSNGRVFAMDRTAPATKDHNGERLEDFASQVMRH